MRTTPICEMDTDVALGDFMRKTAAQRAAVNAPARSVILVSFGVDTNGERVQFPFDGAVNAGGASQGVETADVFSADLGIGEVIDDAETREVEKGSGRMAADMARHR